MKRVAAAFILAICAIVTVGIIGAQAPAPFPAIGSVSLGNLTTGSNPGPIPYVSAAGTLSEDATQHCWDATNHRESIGGCAPSAKLDVTTGGTTHVYVDVTTDNSAYNALSLNGNLGWASLIGLMGGGSADTGLYFFSPGNYTFRRGSSNLAAIQTAGFKAGSGLIYGFSSTTDATAAADAGFSRDAAGIIDVGNGTAGDKTGILKLAGIISGGTQSVSGCSLSANVGGTMAGKYASGTSGTCTVVITPGFTAPNGFACRASDLTTPADVINQTVTSTTACTVAGTTVSGDVITWTAIAY